MIGRQMRIAFDHHRRAPATETLQLMRWRPRLTMPSCPRVADIVPAKILDSSPFERFLPRVRIGSVQGLACVSKHSNRVLADLSIDRFDAADDHAAAVKVPTIGSSRVMPVPESAAEIADAGMHRRAQPVLSCQIEVESRHFDARHLGTTPPSRA